MTAPQQESLYRELILEHQKRPHHKGLREPYDAEVHHLNPTCGDEITLRVQLDGDTVADVSYVGEGCAISQASASMMTDLLIGSEVAQAQHTYDEFHRLMHSRGQLEPDEDVLGDAVALKDVSKLSARVKCALLAWVAWKDAVTQVRAHDDHGTQSTNEGAA